MRSKKLAWLAITALAATALTACTIGAAPAPTVDVNAIYTSAAQTLVADLSAQMTQTAQAVPPTPIPTNTPLATFTLLPTFPPPAGLTQLPGVTPSGSGTPFVIASPIATQSGPLCNDSAWIADIGVQDNDVLKPGADFQKIWRVKNTGTCKWDDGYVLAFISGDKMDGYDYPLKKSSDFVEPGETHDFGMDLTAHLAEGTYQGCWKLRDDHGFFFGTPLCYIIIVKK